MTVGVHKIKRFELKNAYLKINPSSDFCLRAAGWRFRLGNCIRFVLGRLHHGRLPDDVRHLPTRDAAGHEGDTHATNGYPFCADRRVHAGRSVHQFVDTIAGISGRLVCWLNDKSNRCVCLFQSFTQYIV